MRKILLLFVFISFLKTEAKKVSLVNEPLINLFLETTYGQAAFIKNMYSKNGEIYFVLDFINLEYQEHKVKVINTNPKVRTFKLSDQATIEDCIQKGKINIANILEYENEILHYNDFIVMFDIENGIIKSINLGCYN